MESQTNHTNSTLTSELIDLWFARVEHLRDAPERVDFADSTAHRPQASQTTLQSSVIMNYGRQLLHDAVGGVTEQQFSTVTKPVPQSDGQACVVAYLAAMSAGVKAASAGTTFPWSDAPGAFAGDDIASEPGAAPIAVAAGFLAGAAALAQASDRSDTAEDLVWAPEAAAAAAGAAFAADAAADGSDLAVTVRSAARAAGNIHHGPTRIQLILTALADVVAPASFAEVLLERELAGADVVGFRIAFSMDASSWATPATLAAALKSRCSAFECTEDAGVCDVELLTDEPGPVLESAIKIGSPYHLLIEHLDIVDR